MRYTVAGIKMPSTLDALVDRLDAAKSHFGPRASSEIKQLLKQVAMRAFSDPKLLIRFHESLLFIRAFPQSKAVVAQVESLLDSFHRRVERMRELGADMSIFDDFDTSGISGTTMRDTLTFDVARWLVRRIPREVDIAWNDYDDERAMGTTWPRLIPLLREDSDVEANIPWRKWLDAARGRERDIAWLLRAFEQMDLGNDAESLRRRSELYDSLRIPLRWKLSNLKMSRTRNWSRPRKFFFHTEPLIARKQVSLAQELARPVPKLQKLSRIEGERVMETIREVMVVRYRELYGTTLGDARSVVRADVGRGVVMFLWNLPPGRRLPLRAYVAGLTLKNGVPINYIEAIGLCEWIEVGFNTFYTYRHGETAWIYAQVLRCLRRFTGAKTFSVYPYQIGQNNDEALDSGAFWFYRKLGFRSGDPALEALARKEEQKIAADPNHRTSRSILKRIAEAHVFYETPERANAPSRSSDEWDRFSTRNLGLQVNRKMAREFGGDASKIREGSVELVARALGTGVKGWNLLERRSLENWSLVLALLPDIAKWSPAEKRTMVEIIRAQAGASEMRYLRFTQRHARLRTELLRLGSSYR